MSNQIEFISMKDLYEKFQNLSKDELIIDVRTADEYNTGHIPGSRNISHESITNHLGELKPFKKIYLYCRSGGRVQFACGALSSSGVKNAVGAIGGGMPDWISNGYPVEK